MQGAFGAAGEDLSETTGRGKGDIRISTTVLAVYMIGLLGLTCNKFRDSRTVAVRHDRSCLEISRDHMHSILVKMRRITDLRLRLLCHRRWRVQVILMASQSLLTMTLTGYQLGSQRSGTRYDPV